MLWLGGGEVGGVWNCDVHDAATTYIMGDGVGVGGYGIVMSPHHVMVWLWGGGGGGCCMAL